MRALIVTHNALAAEALRRELRNAPSCEVLGYVNGRYPCAASIMQAAPDVVIIDDMGAPTPALARIRDARAAVPRAKLILLTSDKDERWLGDAADAGIDAVISKTVQAATVGLLIREVAAGNVFHGFSRPAAEPETSSAGWDLTARELEILSRMAAGASNGEIAKQLFVTEQTVKFHLSNVYRKLGVTNRTQASHIAHVHGLLDGALRTGAGDVFAPVAIAA